MSTILDSLKKSSDKRDSQNSGSMDNFNFGSPKNSSSLRYVLLFLFIVVFAFGFYYYMKNFHYADIESTDEEVEKVETESNLNHSNNKVVKTNAIKEAKIEKPNIDEVKQRVKQLESKKLEREKNLVNEESSEIADTAKKMLNGRDKSELKENKTAVRQISSDQINKSNERKKQVSELEQRINNQGIVKAVDPSDYEVLQQEYQYVHQLPFSIRKDLPKFKLNVHIYDKDPDSRVAIINGVRFYINDMIEETVLVKDIIQDGVLLDYNGVEFLIPRL